MPFYAVAIFGEKMTTFGNLKKKKKYFGNFLTFKWQFSGGSAMYQAPPSTIHSNFCRSVSIVTTARLSQIKGHTVALS